MLFILSHLSSTKDQEKQTEKKKIIKKKIKRVMIMDGVHDGCFFSNMKQDTVKIQSKSAVCRRVTNIRTGIGV